MTRSVPADGAVDWRRDLGGGTSVALVQAGTFRSDAGALFGPVPRLLWDRWAGPELGSKYQGQSEPTASAFHRDFSNGKKPGG